MDADADAAAAGACTSWLAGVLSILSLTSGRGASLLVVTSTVTCTSGVSSQSSGCASVGVPLSVVESTWSDFFDTLFPSGLVSATTVSGTESGVSVTFSRHFRFTAGLSLASESGPRLVVTLCDILKCIKIFSKT